MKITDILSEALITEARRKRKPAGFKDWSPEERLKWKKDNGEEVPAGTKLHRLYSDGHPNPYDPSAPDPQDDPDRQTRKDKKADAMKAAKAAEKSGASKEDQARAAEKHISKDKVNNTVASSGTVVDRNTARSVRKDIKANNDKNSAGKGTTGSGTRTPATQSVQDAVRSGSKVASNAVAGQRKQAEARKSSKTDKQAVQDVANERRGAKVKTPTPSEKRAADRRKESKESMRQQAAKDND